jgi:HSP20 family protein
MQLTRWIPRQRSNYRSHLFPTLMDDFFYPLNRSDSSSFSEMMPSVDIYEKDEKIFFEAEVPGFKKEDLHVDVKGKIVTISGESKSEREENENSYRKERKYGRFERSFQLGFEADGDAVEAKHDNGILTVSISKPKEQQKKQIEIH